MCIRDRVYTLLVVAAVAVLLATLFLPVLQVSGDSMNPTLPVSYTHLDVYKRQGINSESEISANFP